MLVKQMCQNLDNCSVLVMDLWEFAVLVSLLLSLKTFIIKGDLSRKKKQFQV